MSNGYQDLQVWQRSIELVTTVYDLTRSWPSDERFGLTAQVRRAAVSVPSNVAEGNGRTTPGEDIHSLGISRGSLFEVETQLIVARNLTFCDGAKVAALLNETGHIGRMLTGLINSRRRKRAQ